MISNSK